MLTALLPILIAYLCGSVLCGPIVCRCLGLPDLRTFGSHNIGTTNVLRTGNRLAALLTFAGDFSKGLLPLLGAIALGFSEIVVAACAVAAVAGHVWPLWSRFQGGKGVGTALGAITAIQWSLGLSAALIWLAVAACFRYASLASLSAITASFALGCVFALPPATLSALALLLLLVAWKHLDNLQRLWRGVEKRLGERA